MKRKVLGNKLSGHNCHSACSCEQPSEEVIEVPTFAEQTTVVGSDGTVWTTPLPPVVVWCTKCGGPKPCSCG